MYYHALTNSHVTPGRPFAVGDSQYPSDWFDLASPEDIAEHGFQLVVEEGTREDEALFFVSSELNGAVRTIINIPKPQEMLDNDDYLRKEEFMVKFRKLREKVLDRLGGIAGRAVGRVDPAKNDPVLRETCLAAAESLLSITENLPSDYAGTITALTDRYAVIAATAVLNSPGLANAFAQVDQ